MNDGIEHGVGLPKRKRNRIVDFDYSTPGVYFLTACIDKHKCLLWDNVGATIGRPQDIRLSKYGEAVEEAIRKIPDFYSCLMLDHYVVMPNHIHILLTISADDFGRPMVAPTVSTVMQQMKGAVTKRLGRNIWQKSFHDHVIRNEKDYLKIWEYIDNNPMRWKEDCFYIHTTD
jgi:REP element-mobilizing transposase RayT